MSLIHDVGCRGGADCGCDDEGRDLAGRLIDVNEVIAAISQANYAAIAPGLEQLANLLEQARPVRVAPSSRISTRAVVIPTTYTPGVAIPVLPVESARLRVTVVATYQNIFNTGTDLGPRMVWLASDGREVGSDSYGFPIHLGGAAAGTVGTATSLPDRLTLATSAALVCSMTAAPGAPVVVATISEYADLD